MPAQGCADYSCPARAVVRGLKLVSKKVDLHFSQMYICVACELMDELKFDRRLKLWMPGICSTVVTQPEPK